MGLRPWTMCCEILWLQKLALLRQLVCVRSDAREAITGVSDECGGADAHYWAGISKSKFCLLKHRRWWSTPDISPLLSDELTMAQPGLWCFPLAPGVLNHFLENANAAAEGSTSVLWMGYGLRFQACPLWEGGDAESWPARWVRPRCLTWLRPLSLCPGLWEDVLDLAAWLRWGQGCLVQGACWDASRWKTDAKP